MQAMLLHASHHTGRVCRSARIPEVSIIHKARNQSTYPSIDEGSCPSLVSGGSSHTSTSDVPDHRSCNPNQTASSTYNIDHWHGQLVREEPWTPYSHFKLSRYSHFKVCNLSKKLDHIIDVYEGQSTSDASSIPSFSIRSRHFTIGRPVDKGIRKGREAKKRTTAGPRKSIPKHQQRQSLNGDISSPQGTDGAQLRLGFSVFDVGLGQWYFKCYPLKRSPEDHPACVDWGCQDERSVRREHAQWHHERGDIASEAFQCIWNLEGHVSGMFSHLSGLAKEVAMWQQGFVTLYPHYVTVKHLLNPFIGQLFTDPVRAEELLARPVLLIFPQSPQSSPTRTSHLRTISDSESRSPVLAATSSPSNTASQTNGHILSVATVAAFTQDDRSPSNQEAIAEAQNAPRLVSSLESSLQSRELALSRLNRLERTVQQAEQEISTLRSQIDLQILNDTGSSAHANIDDQATTPASEWQIHTSPPAFVPPPRLRIPQTPQRRRHRPNSTFLAAHASTSRRVRSIPAMSQSMPSLTSDNSSQLVISRMDYSLGPSTPPSHEAEGPLGPQLRRIILPEISETDKLPEEPEYPENPLFSHAEMPSSHETEGSLGPQLPGISEADKQPEESEHPESPLFSHPGTPPSMFSPP